MTHREICEDIVKRGTCAGNDAYDCKDCPFISMSCRDVVELAERWLEEHKENPTDKSEAMKRLDAIEAEAKALRDIIEKADKLKFDWSKVYVGIKDGCPYIMAGDSRGTRFRFYSFSGLNKTCYGWTYDHSSAQECLDYHIDAGFTIHAFDTAREAFEFFLMHLPL